MWSIAVAVIHAWREKGKIALQKGAREKIYVQFSHCRISAFHSISCFFSSVPVDLMFITMS
jgi:hypothetical protein